MFIEITNLQNINNDKIIYVYPNIIQEQNKYTTKKLSENEINKIKKIIKQYCNISQNIKQTEIFFKNLIKVNIKQNNKEEHYFIKKENNFKLLENNLINIFNIIQLNENQYPNLSKYDYMCVKNIEIYNIKSIKVLFISYNEETILCLDVTEMKKNEEEIFNKLINIL